MELNGLVSWANGWCTQCPLREKIGDEAKKIQKKKKKRQTPIKDGRCQQSKQYLQSYNLSVKVSQQNSSPTDY